MSTAVTKWGSFELEVANEEAEKVKRGTSNFLKLNPGKNVIRILPPPLGRNNPFTMVAQHYINMPPPVGAVSFNCPRAMAKRYCPACAKGDQLKASKSEKDRNSAFDFFAKKRWFVNVIDRSDEAAGPKILGFGKSIYEKLLDIRRDEDGGDFTHPVDGFDLAISREGSGRMDTKYNVLARRVSPLSADSALMHAWIESQDDHSRIVKVLDDEEIEAKLRGEKLERSEAQRVIDTSGSPRRASRTAAQDMGYDDEDEDV